MMKTKVRLPQVKIYQSIFFSILLILSSISVTAQLQIGSDIDGEAANDWSGYSVSMPDAYTVALGANRNDGNGSGSGHVRVYRWINNSWIQKGGDIDGEAAGDESGSAVSMPDSNTVAIGAPSNDGNGIDAGHVRIYRWNGTAWLQKGGDIDGEAVGDKSSSVSMPDSNTLAIGASWNDGNGSESGHVRIFHWNGNSWIQKGGDINGESADDYSGYSISMPDSNTVAIGASNNDGNGSNSGHVRVYRWNGNVWLQKGIDIDGEAVGDNSGWSVSMPDSNTLAVGARLNSGNGSASGQVRVYRWINNSWVQKGGDIDGEAAGDRSGHSISMPDSNTVAIGAIYNDGNGIESGHVRIYQWNINAWIQKGSEIDGEAARDNFGWSVSMADSNTMAIGAITNDGNGYHAGHVRVFSLCDSAVNKSVTLLANTIISNDSTANYQWVYCDSAYAPVIGEINRSFTPTNTGNYSVIVSRSHCVDTSACYNVVVTSLTEQRAKQEQLTVYPNPTNGAFTIESNAVNNNSPFEIRDIRGKVIQKGKLSGNRTTVDLSGYSSGIYLLRVGNQNIKLVRK